MSNLTRRAFATSMAAAPLARSATAAKPNILWLTCEDTGPHLRACGDEYSMTPNLDKLCARGTIYMNAWSNAPVCAPARSTIISGVYPPSTGCEHMRSEARMPDGWKMFPGYLRDAGYYCSNHVKEDYNLAKPPGTWDDSSRQAHWRKRASGQPFFSVFNFEITHESQIRTRPHQWVHDPAKVRIPAYHPDTIEVRQDWAQYYDNITTMDTQAGQVLADLEKDGLVEDTIVVFFGDHGSGMPRSKRWPYNSGLNVSIVVSIPEKFKHLAPKDYKAGSKNNRLVGFVDLAPTMLSLAGAKAPSFYQGKAFLGPDEAAPRTHSFGFRGRMDERHDLVRSVRNQRYVYIRNYMPQLIYGQHLDYQWETPTTRVWERLYKEGNLNEAQRKYWETKPAEELYDLTTDRDEVKNLASSPAHKNVLDELRKAHRAHELEIRDVGLLPEAEIHSRAGAGAPYDAGHDPKRYPAERILDAADLASSMKPGVTNKLIEALSDPDSAVRYWGAMGVLMRGESEFKAARSAVVKLASDASPSVRVVASELLGKYGTAEELRSSLETLIRYADPAANGLYLACQALNAIDTLGKKAAPLKERIAALPKPKADESPRVTPIIDRLREAILSNVG
jgi:uncharacterized sulfatase